MNEDNYLISVCRNGKVIELCFSSDLSEMDTLKAMHRGSVIEVRQLREPRMPMPEYVSDGRKGKLTKNGKPWANRVQCVETGEIWPSVVDCSKATGIPIWSLYKSVRVNCCASDRHFVLLPPKGTDDDTQVIIDS